ncbi:hypothetical protein [Eisenbergiella sp.]
MDKDKKYQIIRKGYKGEESRDASSTIRGFLFQDLIAIQKLVNPSTEAVCSEYIEDVMVFEKDATYVIQAKYYPSGGIIKKEIMRELYYQYVRLQLLGYEKIKPILAAYYPHNMRKPSEQVMWSYIEDEDKTVKSDKEDKKTTESFLEGIGTDKEDNIITENPKDIEKWLEKEVYPKKKEEAEQVFFEKYASKSTVKAFVNDLVIDTNYQEIGKYRESVAKELEKINFPECTTLDKEQKTSILIGLAVQYIQGKYNEKVKGTDLLEEILCTREKFLEYLKKNLCVETDERIAAYIQSVILDVTDEILTGSPNMGEEQIKLLECIQENTSNWMRQLVSNSNGRLQLLNTVSGMPPKKLEKYEEKSIREQYGIIREHREKIEFFLRYLWKIMMNINQDLLQESHLTESQKKRLMPQYYVDSDEKRYISLHFPKEEVQAVAIVSPAVRPNAGGILENIFSRMREFQPEKWYMCGDYHGIYKYDMDISQIKEAHMVSTLEEKCFRIECMECMVVEDGCWDRTEVCEKTIFTNTCVKGEEEK